MESQREVAQDAAPLKERWAAWARTIRARGGARPAEGGVSGGMAGGAAGASIWVDGTVVHVPKVACRRVRCAACGARWTLRPPGLAPHKHYQLDVVAEAAASYLLDPGAALEPVAAAFRCARRTVARWIQWVASLAAPAALLQRLAEITPAPIVPRRPAPPSSSRPRHALADRAAEVLTLFEALGTALGAEPPGLRAVLERLGLRAELRGPRLARSSARCCPVTRARPAGTIAAWPPTTTQPATTSEPSSSRSFAMA
jgi:hypothetical protein